MINGKVQGETRVLGKSQGYKGLSVKDDNQDGVHIMRSVWLPNTDELERLQNGASVVLLVAGTMHPPVMVEVGDAPK